MQNDVELRRGVSFFASLALLLGLAACSADGTMCGPDAHCGTRDAAADGHDGIAPLDAHASDDCRDGGSCPSGMVCDAATGRCATDRGPCATDNDCQDDSHCVAGRCVPFAPGGTNAMCTRPPVPAFLQPGILCTSPAVAAGDPFPTLINIAPALVAADFGFGHTATTPAHPSIVAVMGGLGEGGTGVIRVYDGATCALQYVLDAHVVEQDASAAIGDLDGDGVPEIIGVSFTDPRAGVADADDGGLVAFKYDAATNAWRLLWRSHNADGTHDTAYSGENWSSPSLADLDDDGVPEVTYGPVVYDHNGQVLDAHLYTGTDYSVGTFGVTADVDNDARHIPELVRGSAIYAWNIAMHQWEPAAFWHPTMSLAEGHVAIADFGDFPGTAHGDPEIAVISSGMARVQTIHGDVVFGPYAIPGGGTGGPPTAADFNGDGQADFATAARARYVVFDFACDRTTLPAGCEARGIRWSRPNQDASSNVTGSSVFDFNGDGAAEAVYADECFTRVYDGTTGSVLFSRYRSSGTWYEFPIVLDVNGDLKAEIAIGANLDAPGCTSLAPDGYDTIFPGLRCAADADCPTAASHCGAGFCRCTATADCGDPGFGCEPPDTGTAGSGDVCRAMVQAPFAGFQVFGDPHGRWTASRPVWNEHTYSVTNVSDTGTIPASHARAPNWRTPGLNDFRQNTQGMLAANATPDLTAGPGSATMCMASGSGATATSTLSSPVCNRGTAPVAAGLLVAFDVVGMDGGVAATACTATTRTQLAPGACEMVQCVWSGAMPGMSYQLVVVPDPMHSTLQCLDGNDTGGAGTLDCHSPG